MESEERDEDENRKSNRRKSQTADHKKILEHSHTEIKQPISESKCGHTQSQVKSSYTRTHTRTLNSLNDRVNKEREGQGARGKSNRNRRTGNDAYKAGQAPWRRNLPAAWTIDQSEPQQNKKHAEVNDKDANP